MSVSFVSPCIGFHERKPNGLPYKWPLLADGQDPDALEARLAYHLHRLRLTGAPLRGALRGKASLATALSQARASVDHNFIADLAATLNIAADELSRAPTDDEGREWSFYRISAQNRQVVWDNAMEVARRHGMSLRETAAIIGMSVADLSNAISGKRQHILEHHQAQTITALDNPPSDPARFLPTHDR